MQIELFFKEYFDLELLEKGLTQRLLRLFVNAAELPVIIGFSDLLDRVKLVINYPQKQAFLSIWSKNNLDAIIDWQAQCLNQKFS